MADVQKGGRRARASSSGKMGESRNKQGEQAAAEMIDLQREYLSVHGEYAKTVGEALQALRRTSAEAQTELARAVQELSAEMREDGETAARAYPERVHRALTDADTTARLSEAQQGYIDALRELASAQSDAARSARDAYQEYVNAVQFGDAEDEVRARAERAQQAQTEALRASSPGGELYVRVSAAERKYEQVLRETQTATLQELVGAAREYAGSPHRMIEEREIPMRYGEAARRYQGRLQELANTTQRTLLQAQIRALRELQGGWAEVGAAAGAADGSSDGDTAGA
jgi:hypothetical protein